MRGVKRFITALFAAMAIFLSSCGITAERTVEASMDNVSLGSISLSLEKRGFSEEVEPQNPAGYYDMYEKYEGYRYYVLEGYAENRGTFAVSQESFKVIADTDGGSREGKLVFMDRMASRFGESLEPDVEIPCLLFVLLKDNETPTAIDVYYNDGYEKGDGSSFDECTHIAI